MVHFQTFLEAWLQRHPQDAGQFFQKGQHGKTVCDCAFDKYGKEQTSNILRDLIPPDAPQSPILHHVGKYIPRYMDDAIDSVFSTIDGKGWLAGPTMTKRIDWDILLKWYDTKQ